MEVEENLAKADSNDQNGKAFEDSLLKKESDQKVPKNQDPPNIDLPPLAPKLDKDDPFENDPFRPNLDNKKESNVKGERNGLQEKKENKEPGPNFDDDHLAFQ